MQKQKVGSAETDQGVDHYRDNEGTIAIRRERPARPVFSVEARVTCFRTIYVCAKDEAEAEEKVRSQAPTCVVRSSEEHVDKIDNIERVK